VFGLPVRPLPDDLAEHDRLDRNDPHVRMLLRREQDGRISRGELEDQVHDYRLRTARRRKADQEAVVARAAEQREQTRCRACGQAGAGAYLAPGGSDLCDSCRAAATYVRGREAAGERLPDGRLRDDAVLRYLARVEAEASNGQGMVTR
jgi:hypothetical protein